MVNSFIYVLFSLDTYRIPSCTDGLFFDATSVEFPSRSNRGLSGV